jgi:hypothetical protein
MEHEVIAGGLCVARLFLAGYFMAISIAKLSNLVAAF